ncbi:MAG TPA: type II secretion system protein [Gemmatimonadales bacterium]|nr:type II secretion system protein [Gemmatimonadales bacterium]
MSGRNRSGFTLLELLVVMIVMGILATLATFRFTDAKNRAIAAQATSDMETVRLSAYSRYYETGVWPSDAPPGTVPAELTPYLVNGFPFNRPDYTLQFENNLPGNTPYEVAVRLTTTNQRLLNTLINGVGKRQPYIVEGNALVVVLVGPDGQT